MTWSSEADLKNSNHESVKTILRGSCQYSAIEGYRDFNFSVGHLSKH
jgi:hypothetical protein